MSAVFLSWGSDEASWDKNSVEATEAALQVSGILCSICPVHHSTFLGR